MRIDKALWTTVAGWAALAAAVSLAAVQDRGADTITLQGGSRGDVPFPHRQHQETLADCNTCHDTFPREAGAVERLKAAGSLPPKHVMNKLCTKCHREKKRAGEASGPTTCNACHQGG